MKSFINILKQNLQLRHWIGAYLIIASLSLVACESKQDQGSESNVGTTQSEMEEVDTTSSASRGGTTESTGRANTDTSGTGKASGTR